VTITTVGYGDFYPVTLMGRLTGIFVMFAGIGIIGALASILASMLVSPSTPDEPTASDAQGTEASAPDATATDATAIDTRTADAILGELASLRAEVAELRASLQSGG